MFRRSVFLLLLVGCTTTAPLEEYTLARTAFEAAQEQQASRYAPSYFHQAEEAFREGERLYRDETYKEAEEAFLKAKTFAEKAENTARIQRFKKGEVP